mmetsp:Transcript_95564/g.279460  ORF Transcript_95564/g.279460 Transcript_95564/m.279460 type:complete len:208 (-) Transcript_95564:151-774(-)
MDDDAAESSSAPNDDRTHHKIWGRIEDFGSSCSSDSIDRKLAVVMANVGGITISDSSSIEKRKDSDGGTVESPAGGPPGPGAAQEEGDAMFEDPSLVTQGSWLHASGNCRPCDFMRTGHMCWKGSSCNFCHYHPGLRLKRPGKRKRKRARMAAARCAMEDEDRAEEQQAQPAAAAAAEEPPASSSQRAAGSQSASASHAAARQIMSL